MVYLAGKLKNQPIPIIRNLEQFRLLIEEVQARKKLEGSKKEIENLNALIIAINLSTRTVIQKKGGFDPIPEGKKMAVLIASPQLRQLFLKIDGERAKRIGESC